MQREVLVGPSIIPAVRISLASVASSSEARPGQECWLFPGRFIFRVRCPTARQQSGGLGFCRTGLPPPIPPAHAAQSRCSASARMRDAGDSAVHANVLRLRVRPGNRARPDAVVLIGLYCLAPMTDRKGVEQARATGMPTRGNYGLRYANNAVQGKPRGKSNRREEKGRTPGRLEHPPRLSRMFWPLHQAESAASRRGPALAVFLLYLRKMFGDGFEISRGQRLHTYARFGLRALDGMRSNPLKKVAGADRRYFADIEGAVTGW